MKFVEEGPFAIPEAAARRLLEIAKATEPNDNGRIDCGQVSIIFLREGGRPHEYRAGIAQLVSDGAIEMHECGTFFVLKTDSATA